MSDESLNRLYLDEIGYVRRPQRSSSEGARLRRRFHIVFVNSGESCADVMKREYGLWHHRYYDDPELSQYGVEKSRELGGDDYFRRLFARPFFVGASSQLRAQETAHAMSAGVEGVIGERVYVLPYIDEPGGGAAMDETRRQRMPGYGEGVGAVIDPSLYVRGAGSPEKFLAWLGDAWATFRDFLGGAEGAVASGRPGSVPILFDYMQGGGAYTAPVNNDTEINLFIVSHGKFMERFMRKFWRPPFVEFAPLDEMHVYIELDREGVPRVHYLATQQRRSVATERSACDVDVHGGRCRKRVCKSVRRRRRVTEGADRQCRAIRNLLENAGEATYAHDIVPVARILREDVMRRPGFVEAAQRLERLYKPGWFTTRSNRRLPEDLGEAMTTCGITVEPVERRAEPGARRYGAYGGTRHRKQGCRSTRGRRRGRRRTRSA